jgi:hypothetical protein
MGPSGQHVFPTGGFLAGQRIGSRRSGRARELDDKLLQLDPEFASAYGLRLRLEMRRELPEHDPEGGTRGCAHISAAGTQRRLRPPDARDQLGHFDEASAEFASALRLNPHPDIWESGLHAVASSAAGHHERAIAEVEAAIVAAPKTRSDPSTVDRAMRGPGIMPRLPGRSSERASSIPTRRCTPSLWLRPMNSWDASTTPLACSAGAAALPEPPECSLLARHVLRAGWLAVRSRLRWNLPRSVRSPRITRWRTHHEIYPGASGRSFSIAG